MTEHQIERIRHFASLLDKGQRVSGQEVKELTDLYNELFSTRLASTSCSSCIRQRIGRLRDKLNDYEKSNN